MLEAAVINARADNMTLKPKIKAAMVRSRSGIYLGSVVHRGRLADVSVEVGAIV
jgi:hypothetical protein